MSAFVVSNETIHRIVAYLRANPDVLPDSHGERIARKHDRYQCGPFDPEAGRRDAWAELAAELRLLNVAAVSHRYPGSGNDLPGPIGPDGGLAPYDHRDIASPSQIVAHKALGCFLYQCAEGNIPEAELYKMMEATHASIAARIISNMPAWQSAAWG